jgi:NTE family protein
VIPDQSFHQSGYTLRSIYDQLDNTNFPHSGASARVTYFKSSTGLGADSSYERIDFRGVKAFTRSRNTLLLTVRAASDLSSTMPFYDDFTLGGLFNLSAYPTGYFVGGRLAYANLLAYRQVSNLPPMKH